MPPSRPPSSATGAPGISPPSRAAIPRRSAKAGTTSIDSPTGSTAGSVKKGRAEEVHREHPAAGGGLPPGAPGSHGGRPDAAGGPPDPPDRRAQPPALRPGGHPRRRPPRQES